MALPAGLSVRLEQRAPLQGAASFYEQRYTTEPEYRTRDRRLSPHMTAMAGAALSWAVIRLGSAGTLHVRVAADALAWRYDEFGAPELTARSSAELVPLGWITGAVLQFGLEVRP